MRPLVGLLALVAAAGCSGNTESADDDNAAITAAEANAQGLALNEHVLAGVPASEESAGVLGIKSWDVFAGIHEKTGFKGAVFYASDAAGDAKYVLSIDEVTGQMALFLLAKDGKTDSQSKLSQEQYDHLMKELARLKGLVDGGESRASACAKLLVAGGVVAVLATLGVVGPIGGLMLAHYGVSLGAIAAGGEEVVFALAAIASIIGGYYGIGIAYEYSLYSATTRVVGAVGSTVSLCVTGKK